jgi:hypothetical protein
MGTEKKSKLIISLNCGCGSTVQYHRQIWYSAEHEEQQSEIKVNCKYAFKIGNVKHLKYKAGKILNA